MLALRLPNFKARQPQLGVQCSLKCKEVIFSSFMDSEASVCHELWTSQFMTHNINESSGSSQQKSLIYYHKYLSQCTFESHPNPPTLRLFMCF